MKEFIIQYASYNLWANKRIAELIVALDASVLDKEVKSSFPSIRKTVHHIWDAELIWMARLNGELLSWPPSAQFQSPAINQFTQTSQAFVSFIEAKDESFLNSKTTYTNTQGKQFTNVNSGIITHCMNHSTFHRGQLITILRELGMTQFSATDLIVYLRETNK